MVMHSFSLDCWSNSLGGRGGACGRGVPEFLSLGVKPCFSLMGICMFEFLVLDAGHLVGMLLGENLAVLDRLNGGVEVVLVNLPLHGGHHFLVANRLNFFMFDSWSLALLDRGFVMTSSSNKVGDCCFSLVHDLIWFSMPGLSIYLGLEFRRGSVKVVKIVI